MTVVDWRERQLNPPAEVRGKQKHARYVSGPKRGRVIERDPAKIDGIVIHQTACVFGASPGHDRHERAFGVACHALAFNDGTAIIANPLRWLVWHGNGFNDRSLCLECEANARGLMGDSRTVQGREAAPTIELIESSREALRALVELGRAEGMPLRYIWAHRQSSPTRRSDPGEELWRRVVLEYAVPVLGLVTEPALTLESKSAKSKGHGRPIPLAWDPDGVGSY